MLLFNYISRKKKNKIDIAEELVDEKIVKKSASHAININEGMSSPLDYYTNLFNKYLYDSICTLVPKASTPHHHCNLCRAYKHKRIKS